MKRLLAVALVLSLLTGCGDGRVRVPAPPAPSTPTAMAMPAYLRVTGLPGGSLIAVVRHGGAVTITSRLGGPKVTIAGKAGRYTRRGRLLAVVKTSRDGVRLTTSHGRTLWRARIVHGRVQIRRGETRSRYEFRRQGEDQIIVRKGAAVIGGVRAIEEGAVVEAAGGARLGRSSSPPGNDMAVLLCHEIPPDLRAVLAAAMLGHR